MYEIRDECGDCWEKGIATIEGARMSLKLFAEGQFLHDYQSIWEVWKDEKLVETHTYNVEVEITPS